MTRLIVYSMWLLICGVFTRGEALTLTGRLTGPNTSFEIVPISGATVTVAGYPSLTATTDASGMFTLSGTSAIPRNSVFCLKVVKTGYKTTYTVPTGMSGDIPFPGKEPFDIGCVSNQLASLLPLAFGITLNSAKGHIFLMPWNLETGQPIVGAGVKIRDLSGTQPAGITIKYLTTGGMSDDPGSGTGIIAIFNVPPGMVMVSAQKDGHDFAWRPAVVYAGAFTSGVSMYNGVGTSSATATVNGVVKDGAAEEETGIPGAAVTVPGTALAATTNSNGEFSLLNTPLDSTAYIKASKTAFMDGYKRFSISAESSPELALISQTVINSAKPSGVTINTSKGHLVGDVREGWDQVDGAAVSVVTEDGVSAGTIYYMNDDMKFVTGSVTTTAGVFGLFNVTPNVPVFVRATKVGSEFPLEMAVMWANGMTRLKLEEMPPFDPQASSAHTATGYYAWLSMEDSPQAASRVTVSGPDGDPFDPMMYDVDLVYNAETGRWEWDTALPLPFLGLTPPPGTPTYTFTATTASGDVSIDRPITGYVTDFASNLSPSGGGTSRPTLFTWQGINGESVFYQVELKHGDDLIWSTFDRPSPETFAVYDGPALEPGVTYSWAVLAGVAADESTNFSIVEETFSIQPQGPKGDINLDQVINLTDAVLCFRMVMEKPVTIDGETYEFPYDADIIFRADANSDGVVDMLDVILILRLALGAGI